MSDFSIRLKEQMDKAGLRAIDISNATGINRATISQYLSGKYVPKQDKLLKIASVLNIKPSEVLSLTGSSKKGTIILKIHLKVND